MPGIPSKDASFVWGTPRNYALTIYEKFCLALNLTNESENVAIETCMRWYIVTDDESM